MAKIIQKKLMFDAPEVVDDIVSYNIYYAQGELMDYDSNKINIPAVEGKETYTVVLDGNNIPLTEGIYNIGVSSVDKYGNESDIEEISFPFDLTPPPSPVNLRIE